MTSLSAVAYIFLVILYSDYGLTDDTIKPCSDFESVNITTGITYENGSVFFEEILYTQGTWFIEDDGENVTLYGCPCLIRNCLWKCCDDGHAYIGSSCNETNITEVNPFSPLVYNDTQLLNLAAHQHFHYMYTRQCDGRYRVDPLLNNEEFYIQANGTLYEIANGYKQWLPSNLYCVDYLVGNTTADPRMIAHVCFPDDAIDDSPTLYVAYGVGLLLSVPFLLATFLVYAFIPELRNVHGMCLMAYCSGLIVGYTFLAYLKLNVGSIDVPLEVCLGIAFSIYYAFQTSFFWLNVMCFDIWRTFSGYRGGSNHKRRERKRFAMYGAYAWGVPVILTAITIGMHLAAGDLPEDIIKPGFGRTKCWFSEWKSELVYFFTPVLALVVVNVVLFAVTAHRIRSIRQETAILKSSESARSDRLKKDKQRYGLYLKLFMVMGVNWVVELVSFGVGGSNWYWIVIDLSNIGLGIFIFIIFVWKDKVRNLIRKRFRGAPGVSSTGDSNTGRWATRSSSAPTEDTRVSSEDAGIRLNPR